MSHRPPLPSWLFSMAVLLAVVSGAAALTHQLLWTRRLIDLLGASHESAARVFGCFFLGLALGAAVAAWLLPRVRRPWRWVAAADAAVIALSMPAILLPWWTQGLWPALGQESLQDWRGGLVKLLASILVVLPPATAMGATLPFLGAAILRGHARLGRHGLWLYGANTVGGVLGLTVTVLILLQTLGSGGSMWAAVVMNLLVVALAVGLDRADPAPGLTPQAPARQPAGVRGVQRWAAFIAFVSGFGILAFEVAALQVVMLIAPLSFYAPAAILMVIIALLAAGALATPVVTRWFGSAERAFPWVLALTGLFSVLTPVFFFLVIERGGDVSPMPTLPAWMAHLTLLVLLTLGPAVLLAALVFPCTLAWLSDAGADPYGRRWGWLLAANGLGGLLGAEIAYRGLLPWLGPHVTIGTVGLMYAVLAVVLLGQAVDASRRAWLATGGALMVSLFIVSTWLQQMPLVNPHMGFNLIDHRSGREGTVAVIEQRDGHRALLMSNQYMLGGTGVRWDQQRQAHLPLMLHPQPREVAMIGLATGITAGAALSHGDVEDLTTIELSPLVTDLARKHFAEYNNGLFEDDRSWIVIEDGRTYIAATQQRYDVIVGDLYLPWGPGEARLYSIEHFIAARGALRDGGVFCQWLAMYQLTPQQFETIAATFQQVFPETHVVINGFSTGQPMLALVGFHHGEWDWQAIAKRTERGRRDGLKDPLMRHVEGIELLYLGRLETLTPQGLNTLDNMRIELDAGRQRITGDPGGKYHFGRRWHQSLQHLPVDWRGRRGDRRKAPLTLDLLAAEALPTRQRDRQKLFDLHRRLPAALRGDPEGDASRWPGDRRVLDGPLRGEPGG